jgi:integrase
VPRPRADGSPPMATVKRKFMDVFINSLKAGDRRYICYDERQRGLAVIVQAKPSTSKSYACLYYSHGSPRWMSLGRTNAIGLSDARKMAAKIALEVANGKDPAAEKRAARGRGTFAEVAVEYVEQHAKIHNKSWKQAARLIDRYVVPRIGALPASGVTRNDVKNLLSRIEAPILSNQVLASTSAVFSWAIREQIVAVNPCVLIKGNPTRARERIMSDSEVPKFWKEFDDLGIEGMALKMVLLTGARPGEIVNMRSEHVVDNVWTLPGRPDEKTGWLGTKNGQTLKLPLSKPAQAIIAELDREGSLFGGVHLDAAMRAINKKLAIKNRVRPHDLRRTASSMIAGTYGMEHMDRLTNHAICGVRKTYNRFDFASKDREIMEWLGSHIVGLAEGGPPRTWFSLASRFERERAKAATPQVE